MATRIQLRRDTASNWTSVNPTLAEGELGYETDTGKVKLGNGSTAWASLGYYYFTVDLGDLSDVTITSAADGDFLRWNGTAWINDAVNLGTDSVGDYVESLVAGTGITLSNNTGEGATPTISIGQSVDTTDNVTFNNVTLTGTLIFETVNGGAYDLTFGTETLTDNRTVQFPNESGVLATYGNIELGTDTVGNYVSDVSGGTGVSVSHTPGEGSTPTVSIGQAVASTDSPTFAGLTINGSQISFEGNTADDYETTINVEDPTADRTISFPDSSGVVALEGQIELGTDTTGNYVSDVSGGTGVTITHTPGEGSTPTVAIGQSVGTTDDVTFNSVTGNLIGDVKATNGTTVLDSGTDGTNATFTGDVTGDLTGNADTASALATSRTIELTGDVTGSVSFDGSANVQISTTIGADTVALGTDTTGDYVDSVTGGTGVTVTGGTGEGSTPSIAIGQAVGTTDSVTFANVTISNAPSQATHAATKSYVDNAIAGIDWHQAVKLATAAALPNSPSYSNGTSGVGATLTATAYARLQIDGTNATTGDRVLVKNQSTATHNGVYDVTEQGNGVDTYWVLTRATDFDSSPTNEIKPGEAVFVLSGATNIRQGFVLTTTGTGTDGAHVLDTDDLTFTQFTGTSAFTAGDGISQSGNVLNVGTASAARIVVNSDNIDLATVGQTDTSGSATTTFVSGVTVDSYGRVTGQETSAVSFNNTALTGTPTAPTASIGDSSTQVATTAFVDAEIGDQAVLKSVVDAKGDIVVASGADAVTRLAVGADGYYLKANSGAANGVEWAAIPEINNIDDIGDVTITSATSGDFLKWNGTAWVNDAIDLGTDTTGNYMTDVSAGTGISVSHTPSEGSTATVSLDATLDEISDVTITSAANGQILQYDGTNWINTVQAGGEPIGHENKADSSISFNNSTRVFTIQPSSSSFTVWCKGKRFVKSSAETVTIDATTGLYYIYYNTSGVLSFRTSYFDWENDTPTAYIYWNATTSKAEFFADERHGVTLDWQTHEYLHRTRGAAIASGFGASGYSVDGDGTLDSHAQIALTGGTFFDEDLQVDVTHSASPTANTWEQILEGTAEIPVFYRSGTAWVKDTATTFPFKAGTARAQYNAESGGSWSTADVANNKYGAMWIVATNNLNEPIIAILGQTAGDNQSTIEERQWEDLNLDGLPIFEIRPLYRIAFVVSDSFSNTVKAAIRGVLDIRRAISAGSGIPSEAVSDHGTMTGLADDDHTQYLHVTTTRANVSADITTTGTITAATLGTASNVVFEGSTADDYETTLAATDPTADRTITLPDASGTIAILGTIALGTDTTGNYVSDVTAGTGVTVTHTPGEGSSPTVAIGQAVGTTDSPTFAGATIDAIQVGITGTNEIDTSSGNLTIDSAGGTVTVDDNLVVSGDLTVNGTTVTVNSTVTTLDDPVITLGGDSAPSTDDSKDRGVEFRWHDGSSAKVGFFGFDDSTGRFTFIPDSTNTSEVFSGTLGNIDVNDIYINGTGSTGTGGVVRAASPSLTTPDLGTPSAATLTNATGLPVSTGISGLGTGVADFLATPSSANLATAVTDETGSGALVFATDPALAGTPTAPTASVGNSSTQIATTAFVDAEIGDQAILNADIAAKGDLIVGASVGTPAILTAGTDGYFLKANSSATNGVEWASIPTINNIDDIGDVTITTPSSGQLLSYDGSGWVNATVSLSSTTGDYVESLVAGTGVTLTNNSGSAATPTVAIGQDVATTASVEFADLDVTTSAVLPADTLLPERYVSLTANTTLSLASHQNYAIEVNSSSALTITIPAAASQDFPVGTVITFIRVGTGEVTISPDSGVTINTAIGSRLRVQWSTATLRKRASDTWLLSGDLKV